MPHRPHKQDFAKGQVIFQQGDPGHDAYIVRTGRVIIRCEAGGETKTIAVRGPGELIGEMALLSGARRSASAVALDDCLLTALPRCDLQERVESADPILKIVLLTAFERLREIAAKENDYIPEDAP